MNTPLHKRTTLAAPDRCYKCNSVFTHTLPVSLKKKLVVIKNVRSLVFCSLVKSLSQNLQKKGLVQVANFGFDNLAKLFCNLTVQYVFRNSQWLFDSLIFGLSLPDRKLKNWQQQPVHASFPPAA
ncbi:hypothetical protein [Maribellus sp. YY47]|uniref:hypothetical protein n=1 Tax=Maribellus sp. YY47 TaxID=2929486 RepID=UPI00200151CE|nr:hypothetical protein [Maribellus sp. YY47]MCK3686436.1 hypothetical protein [Maribellus sp. YY47]